MNQNAQDLMMQAPSEVSSENQLKELVLKKNLKKLIFSFKIYSYIR